ncbi:hypothetical protein J6590_042357 [Homalodisca vitripennis]|nr:hypothetical protein J6590_042357 [Homalodisca vitripennis]
MYEEHAYTTLALFSRAADPSLNPSYGHASVCVFVATERFAGAFLMHFKLTWQRCALWCRIHGRWRDPKMLCWKHTNADRTLATRAAAGSQIGGRRDGQHEPLINVDHREDGREWRLPYKSLGRCAGRWHGRSGGQVSREVHRLYAAIEGMFQVIRSHYVVDGKSHLESHKEQF